MGELPGAVQNERLSQAEEGGPGTLGKKSGLVMTRSLFLRGGQGSEGHVT